MLNLAVIVKHFVMTGGAERHAVEVTRRLLKKGHQVELYCRSADPALTDGLKVTKIPERYGFSSVLSSLAFAFDTAKFLEGKRHDIIHSNERGFAQDVLTLHCFSYRGSQKGSDLLKRLNRIYLSPRSLLYLWLEKRQMLTRCLVAVSELILEDLRLNYRTAGRVEVITPGVDIQHFHPEMLKPLRDETRRALGIGTSELALLFVGSEFKRKGLETVLRVMTPPMKLIVVGKGDRIRYHTSLIKELAIGDMVKIVGLRSDVRPFLAASDVLILPTTSDAFGMSVLEAMACGLPPVMSDRAGVSMLVKDSVNGFVYRTTEQLRSVLDLLKDHRLRESVGKNARETAERHSWDITANAYETLFYDEVRRRKDKIRRMGV